jgi:hypothetical protein
MTELQSMPDVESLRSPENETPIVLESCGPAPISHSDDIAETMYILKLGLRTNLRWLERDDPNVDAAVRTSTRMCEYLEKLETLIRQEAAL